METRGWKIIFSCASAAVVLFLVLAIFLPLPSEGAVIYVTQTGTGLRNGTSWTNACGEAEFKGVLDSAPTGSEIWVAMGKYRPSMPTAAGTPADREASFALKSGVTLYGGFAGGETLVRQRDYRKNITVLTGDLAGDDAVNESGVTEVASDIAGENSYTVVASTGVSGLALIPNIGVLDGFTITGGSADWPENVGGPKQYGGGMYNSISNATVLNCSFTGNSAEWGGAAIFNLSSNLRVAFCTFSGNESSSGSGMYNRSSAPELVNCIFSENSARTDAPAIHNYDGSSPTISGCTFTGNVAERDSGAIANVDNCSPIILNCSFSGNTARSKSTFHLGGGAIGNAGSCNPEITNCTFSGNVAEGGFGGAIINAAKSSAKIVNCTFSENRAPSGGGIFNTDSSPTVVNCTFASNSADTAGGMRNVGGAPVVKNCIFWNNAGEEGKEIVNDPDSSPVVSYCVIRYGYPDGTHIFTGDPRLGPLADNGGYTKTDALFPGSSAIDKGTSSGAPSDDQRDVPRPQGSAYDIGSFEYAPSSDSSGCSAAAHGGMVSLLLLLPALLLFWK